MDLKEIINKIDSLKKELDSLKPIKPEYKEAIWKKLRLDWNFHSNHIEGNTLTFGETKVLLETGHIVGTITKPKRDYDEVIGHDKAIDLIIKLAEEESPLTEAIIRELHKIILPTPYMLDAQTPEGKPTKRSILIGEYKKQPNHVLTSKGEMFYFSSPENTKPKMTELVDSFRNKRANSAKDVLLLTSEFHYKFVLIHPFDDGNGRLARLLLNYFLILNDFPPIIIRTEDKKNYFTALEASDAGNFESLVMYLGEQLVKSLDLYIKGAKGEDIGEAEDIDKRILLLEKEINALGKEELKTTKSLNVIISIFESSIKPLLESVFKKLLKIEKFYKQYEIWGRFDEKYFRKGSKNILNEIQEAIKNSNYWNKLVIYIDFTGFNKPDIAYFDDDIAIKIEFDTFIYTIVIDKTKVNLEKIYSQHITKEEIERISVSLLNKCLDKIEKKITESKTKN